MQITELLARTGGLEAIARELGLDPRQVEVAAGALTPAVLEGLQRQAQGESGGLMEFLERLGGGGLLYEVVAPTPTHLGVGNEVLQQIFGSPDVSRAVAQHAGALTGLDPALLARMLPMLAMVVAGAMALGPAGGLGLVLGGPQQALHGLGVLRCLLDANGDGNVLDDILRLCGRISASGERREWQHDGRRTAACRRIPACGRQRPGLRGPIVRYRFAYTL